MRNPRPTSGVAVHAAKMTPSHAPAGAPIMKATRSVLAIALLLLSLPSFAQQLDLIIRNGSLFDGSGSPAIHADIASPATASSSSAPAQATPQNAPSTPPASSSLPASSIPTLTPLRPLRPQTQPERSIPYSRRHNRRHRKRRRQPHRHRRNPRQMESNKASAPTPHSSSAREPYAAKSCRCPTPRQHPHSLLR